MFSSRDEVFDRAWLVAEQGFDVFDEAAKATVSVHAYAQGGEQASAFVPLQLRAAPDQTRELFMHANPAVRVPGAVSG